MAFKKIRISEEKARKIAVGATVAGVLLIFFLVVVMIIQFVQMGVRSSERAKLEEAQTKLEETISQGQNTLELYQDENNLRWLARTYGWVDGK